MTNPLTNTVINTTNTSVIITGLTPGQYYNINITAVNIIGPDPILMINSELYNIIKKTFKLPEKKEIYCFYMYFVFM